MSYDATDNLTDLDVSKPTDAELRSVLGQAIRELKTVFKNVLLVKHNDDGSFRGIETSDLVDDIISTIKIADDAVVSSKIAAQAIIEEHFSDACVPAGALQEECIAANNFTAGCIPATAFSDSTIATARLIGDITGDKIKSSATVDGDRAISTDHIKDTSVTNGKINDVAVGKITGGADAKIIVCNGTTPAFVTMSGDATISNTGVVTLTASIKTATFGDLKSRGTAGGAVAAIDTWNERDLGEISDEGELMTFTGNEFSLPVGKYYFYAKVPGCGVGLHQARLFADQDTSDAVLLWGSSETAPTVRNSADSGSDYIQNNSVISGVFEITDATWLLSIQHWVTATNGSWDQGIAATSDNTTPYANHREVYTQGYLIKLS